MDRIPRRRASLPWADFLLFAVIIGVVAFWWLRAPSGLVNVREVAQLPSSLAGSLPTEPTEVSVLSLALEDRPTATPTLPPMPTAEPTATPMPLPTAAIGPTRYKVQSGDTVSAIAQRFGSSIKDIIQANSLPANGALRVGQELVIPVQGPTGGPGPTATPQGGTLIYTVQPGDTLSTIAQRFKSQVDWILSVNNLKATDILRITQVLMIPLSPTTPTPTPTTAFTPQSPTPSLTPGLRAPQLLSPPDAATLSGNEEVMLAWTAVGTLATDRYYVVTLRSLADNRVLETWWTKTTTWRVPAEYRGKGTAGVDLSWRVQVRSGLPGQPGESASPSSPERRFTWR